MANIHIQIPFLEISVTFIAAKPPAEKLIIRMDTQKRDGIIIIKKDTYLHGDEPDNTRALTRDSREPGSVWGLCLLLFIYSRHCFGAGKGLVSGNGKKKRFCSPRTGYMTRSD